MVSLIVRPDNISNLLPHIYVHVGAASTGSIIFLPHIYMHYTFIHVTFFLVYSPLLQVCIIICQSEQLVFAMYSLASQ
jgi:hypothetical protein